MKKTISLIITAVIVLSCLTAMNMINASAEKSGIPESGIQAMRDSLTLTFNDEFDGDNIDLTKWKYDGHLTTRNGEPQVYADSDADGNAWLDNGSLVIQARKEDRTVKDKNNNNKTYHYTSAEFSTKRHDFKYGMFEARIKNDCGSGIWPAFWSMGWEEKNQNCDWPTSGEYDIFENMGSQKNEECKIHYSTNGSTSGHAVCNGGTFTPSTDGSETFASNYHVYGMYYTDKVFCWYVDNQIINVYDITDPKFDFIRNYGQFFILNMALGTGSVAGKIPEDFTQAKMYVDYFRVYQATDNDYSHINIIQCEDTVYDKAKLGNGGEPYKTWALNYPKMLMVSSTVSDFIMKTNQIINEGKYDIYINGIGNSVRGAYSFNVNGQNTGYSCDMSLTGSTSLEKMKSWYVGTAELKGNHAIEIGIHRTRTASSNNATSMDCFIIVGKSKLASDVVIGGASETTCAPTTAAPTTVPTTVAPTTIPTTAAPTTVTTTAPTTAADTTIITTAPFTTAPTTEKPVTLGDCNSDTFINAKDVLLLRKHIAKQKVVIDEKAADVDKSGNLNAKDVLLIRKFNAKIIKSF